MQCVKWRQASLCIGLFCWLAPQLGLAEVTVRDLANRQRAAELKKFEDSLRSGQQGEEPVAVRAGGAPADARPAPRTEKPREVTVAKVDVYKVMSIFGPSENLTAEFSTPDGKAGYLRRGDVFLGQEVFDVRPDGVLLKTPGAATPRFVKPGDSLK
ncbi:MAG TPA: hypothetical protein VFV39_07475 [Limnobacter sp.]|nr:hypothetical protein [Limnobacter sp.]